MSIKEDKIPAIRLVKNSDYKGRDRRALPLNCRNSRELPLLVVFAIYALLGAIGFAALLAFLVLGFSL